METINTEHYEITATEEEDEIIIEIYEWLTGKTQTIKISK